MHLFKSFSVLTKFERFLWITSMIVIALSFILAPAKDFLSLAASLIGVTALIFVAKGMVMGQILTVVFAVFYGLISFYFRYFGEMITYLFMTSPMAILAAIEWYKNPYKDTDEVKIREITSRHILTMLTLSIIVTGLFYLILKSLNTTNLFFSTISITTSFIASYLTYLRSPYYALAYAANDIVLIILWVMASISYIGYIPMIFCFVMFLFNDIYGFINWKKMKLRQG